MERDSLNLVTMTTWNVRTIMEQVVCVDGVEREHNLVTMITCMEYENYRGQAFNILGRSLIMYEGDSHWMGLVEKPYF